MYLQAKDRENLLQNEKSANERKMAAIERSAVLCSQLASSMSALYPSFKMLQKQSLLISVGILTFDKNSPLRAG